MNIIQKKKILKDFKLTSLIEFSRSVHAEMEAILSVARYGRRGIVGSTLYVTTYPCENCTKHIIASGIHKVVYIEPYPKSRAYEFFYQLIDEDGDTGSIDGKVKFLPFVGISPESYARLFAYSFQRKDNITGKLTLPDKAQLPFTHAYLDGYTIYESKIVDEVGGLEDEKEV